ncbi:MAG: 6-phosphogluconolactonase [Chlamydiota bacterium]|jgi:6-phosphogluconolactonase
MFTQWDIRRDIYQGTSHKEALQFSVEHWIHTAARSIQQRGRFVCALSGGSTPKQFLPDIFASKDVDWAKVWLFWSDERVVPPDDERSNYKMCMDAGLRHCPIPLNQVFRMQEASTYEELIRRHTDSHLFDLVMLGLGEDGHTASLFPGSPALKAPANQLVIATEHPATKEKRISFTMHCINQSRLACIYALGSAKQTIVKTILNAPILSQWPASAVGTPEHKALFVLEFRP